MGARGRREKDDSKGMKETGKGGGGGGGQKADDTLETHTSRAYRCRTYFFKKNKKWRHTPGAHTGVEQAFFGDLGEAHRSSTFSADSHPHDPPQTVATENHDKCVSKSPFDLTDAFAREPVAAYLNDHGTQGRGAFVIIQKVQRALNLVGAGKC